MVNFSGQYRYFTVASILDHRQTSSIQAPKQEHFQTTFTMSEYPDNSIDEEEVDSQEEEDLENKIRKLRTKKPVKLKLEPDSYTRRLEKRGVVYISWIPPRITPSKLKQLLEQFKVTRIYLVPEDEAVRKRRRKLGGNGSRRFREGWIEFASKKVAKKVAHSLNTTPMSHQTSDLWNLKYLSKFQWSHLTEKVAYERRVRQQQLRMERMQAHRESQSYRQAVEAGKVADHVAKRRRKNDDDQGHQEPRKSKPVRQIKPIEESPGPNKDALIRSLI